MQRLPLEILGTVEVVKLTIILNVKKTSQKIDIPFKIVQLNADFLGISYVKTSITVLKMVSFHVFLNHNDIIPAH